VNDGHKGSQLESRLPDDGGYWDDLAARIVDAAGPILREQREAREWWHPLAKWSPAIGVAAAAAAVLILILGPPQAGRGGQVSFAQLLSPDEPVAQAVVSGAPASEISAMLLVESGGER
jgi:anti-sigma-K factor RskA